jgi:hypothetical protein
MIPNTYVQLPRGGLAEPRFASFPTRRLAVLPSSGVAFFLIRLAQRGKIGQGRSRDRGAGQTL